MNMIEVSRLSKSYKTFDSPWRRMTKWVFPSARTDLTITRRVLEDISFKVGSGEAVGIVGTNGAGKSTLLKMIAGTAYPTSGFVKITGSLASILELGLGFRPELTGRQNATTALQLLGNDFKRTQQLLDDVEEFAEIGDYFELPLRVYSSGMQMRLAFSAVTAQRPDILVVDEALSVGDAYFQHKSFARIKQFASCGTTLLMVSHDKQAILAVCDRVILLNEGRIEREGDPETVLDYYNAKLSHRSEAIISQELNPAGRIRTSSGTKEVFIESILLLDESNHEVSMLRTGVGAAIIVKYGSNRVVHDLVVGVLIKDRFGQPVFGTNSHHLKVALPRTDPGNVGRVKFAFPVNLGEGHYSVSVALHKGPTHVEHNFDWLDHALVFEVINTSYTHFIGSTFLPMSLDVICE